MTCGILVSWPGIEPVPSAMEERSLTHWSPPGKSVEPVLFVILPELWGDHLGNSVVSLEFWGSQCEHTGLKSRFSLNPKPVAFGQYPPGPEGWHESRGVWAQWVWALLSDVCGSPRVPAQTGILGLNVGVERGPATAPVLEWGELGTTSCVQGSPRSIGTWYWVLLITMYRGVESQG